MTTTTHPWLRAELIAGPETTPGAQLMIPADGVEFHEGQLVFHHQGEVVYVADQSQLRSITWFARQPNPETARRKALWPNHGTRWTDDQRADLLRRLQLGQSWAAISTAVGRSRTGCQQEAVKQGWLDPDTLRPRPGLLAGQSGPASDAGDADPPPTASAADSGNASGEPIASAHQVFAPIDAPAAAPAPSTTAEPAGSLTAAPEAPIGSAEAASLTAAASGTSSTGTARPAIPDIRAGSGTEATALPRPQPPPSPAPPSADPSPSEALAALLQGTGAGGDTDSGSSLYLDSMPSAVPMARRDSGDLPQPPQPDTPPSQPRIPRQRSESDPDPESGDDGSSSGDSFMNRAQSSLSRAVLRSYLNPSRGQPTGPA